VRRRAAAACATAATLTVVPAAWAHVTVTPPSVEEDTTARVDLVTPNERPGHETVRLTVRVPGELRIVSATAPDGWVVVQSATTATWSGGAIAGEDSVRFPVQLHGVGPAGDVRLTARQVYEDGHVEQWRPAVVVRPATGAAAPRSHLGRGVVAGLVGVGVIAVSLLALHRLRRPRRARHDGGATRL
jgi:hypothetical protein